MYNAVKTGVASLIAGAAFTTSAGLVNGPAAEEPPPAPLTETAAFTFASDLQPVEVATTSMNIRDGGYGGQCVSWIKALYDTYAHWPDFRGNADSVPTNSETPVVGAAVLTMEPTGHAAVVIGIEDGELVLAESNYNGDERITVGRRLAIGDPRIRGYYVFD